MDDLSVKIFNRSGSLVKKGIAAQAIDISQGNYIIKIQKHDGSALSQKVIVN